MPRGRRNEKRYCAELGPRVRAGSAKFATTRVLRRNGTYRACELVAFCPVQSFLIHVPYLFQLSGDILLAFVIALANSTNAPYGSLVMVRFTHASQDLD
jgi:hypothetical protein